MVIVRVIRLLMRDMTCRHLDKSLMECITGNFMPMNVRSLALAVFVVLTIVFASAAAVEYSQKSSTTTIVISGTTTNSTICTATGGIGCLHFMNENWTISVGYTGPWGVTYHGWLGDQATGQLVASGAFYGNSTGSKTINVSGTTSYGITVCAEAQKLDSSSATLTMTILPPNVTNQTSAAYG
ncbi:MAG: hypothetical protein ACRD6W_10125, partial [Nitrososphaerales archaeon]